MDEAYFQLDLEPKTEVLMGARITIGGDITPYITSRLKQPLDPETLEAAVEVIRDAATRDLIEEVGHYVTQMADRVLRERAIEFIQAWVAEAESTQ
jgi:hypothetical protein